MDVVVIEKATGRVVAEYPIIVRGQNYDPTDAEHFELAWECAVDDGVVSPSERDKYELRRST
jgi:hypothetical protein